MKVYLYIAKQKKTLKMYLPYIEALGKKLDITPQSGRCRHRYDIGSMDHAGSTACRKITQDGHSIHGVSTRRHL